MSDHTSSLVQLPLFDPVEIKLTKGYTAIVDPVDADLIRFKWIAQETHGAVYARRQLTGTPQDYIFLHCAVLERKLGRVLGKGEIPDHIDGNGLNNRRDNLRLATYSQNSSNRKLQSNNKTGYRGVSSNKPGKWVAKIDFNNKQYHLGTFDTPEEAYAAYCEAAKKYHGEFARTD